MSKQPKKLLIIMLLLISMLLAACNQVAPVPEAPTTRSLTDRNGVTYVVPVEVKRVISYSPTYTQVIMDLEKTELLVAVDTNSQRFYELPKELPAFDMMSPDAEQLLALKPDVVFVTDMSAAGGGENPFALLSKNGISVITITTPNTLEEISKDVAFIAEVIGKKEKGAQLAEDMLNMIEEYHQLGEKVTEPKRVYFEISAAPYSYSFGKGVFLNEMLELLGAINVFGDQTGWLSVTAEAAVAANPDVIFTNVDYLEDPVAELLAREGWLNMQAILNQQVYWINPNASSQANHHVIDAMEEMALALGLKTE
jgi:iron complex transport system substrate-binding protein